MEEAWMKDILEAIDEANQYSDPTIWDEALENMDE